MPLQHKLDCDKDVELSVWKALEPISYFENKLHIHPPEKTIINGLKTRKKAEWYSSRYLLHIMSGREHRGKFIKDVHGKPHLDQSDYHISISHSAKYISVIASEKLVGIDIQTYVKKISRIQHKFISNLESQYLKNVNLEHALHIIWGAKESLYKAYGKRGLDFRKHLFISKLDASKESGTFKGVIKIDAYHKEFKIYFQLFNDYVLVYAKESI